MGALLVWLGDLAEEVDRVEWDVELSLLLGSTGNPTMPSVRTDDTVNTVSPECVAPTHMYVCDFATHSVHFMR